MKRGVEMYFMTTLRVCGNIVDDCRTIAMNSSYGDCYYGMLDNTFDIFEGGYYQYAVINFINEGYYPNIIEQQWFKWVKDGDITAVELCNRPAEIGDYKPYIIG